jgi:HSP20 family molecular chaperone IbpA
VEGDHAIDVRAGAMSARGAEGQRRRVRGLACNKTEREPIMIEIPVGFDGEITVTSRKTTSIHYRIMHFYSGTRPALASGAGWVPPADLYDTQDEVIVEMNLGGVEEDDVRIQVDSNLLTISGQRAEIGASGMRCYHVMEIERGSFERVIELPALVDAETARASFHHGLLVIHLAKQPGGPMGGCFSADSMEGLE